MKRMHTGKQGNAVACSCHKFKHSFDPKRKAWWWSRMVATATNDNIIYSLLSILHTLVISWLFSFIYVFFVQSIHSMQSNLPTPSSKVIYKGKIDEKSSS